MYAKLQQVQRRISEAGGSPVINAGPGSRPATSHPQIVSISRPGQPVAEPEPPPLLDQNAGKDGWSVTISAQLLSLLIIIGVLALALMFWLGMTVGRPTYTEARAVAAPVVDTAPPLTGRHILILDQKARPTPKDREDFQKKAEDLNRIIKATPALGGKPWIAVREPDSGQLQLAFGSVDGVWGVDRKAFADFTRVMMTPRPKGGGYGSAQWVELK